jgi:hypothetical protein
LWLLPFDARLALRLYKSSFLHGAANSSSEHGGATHHKASKHVVINVARATWRIRTISCGRSWAGILLCAVEGLAEFVQQVSRERGTHRRSMRLV